MPMAIPNDDEFDDFMARVSEASSTITQLKNGEIRPEEVDDKENLLQQMKEQAAAERAAKKAAALEKQRLAQEEAHRKKWGFVGKWCPRCNKEEIAESTQCAKCKGPVQTGEERKASLMDKVEVYKDDRRKKAEARDRWKRWLSSQQYHRVGSAFTDYSKWDVFEPSDDEEEELPAAPPPDTPEFRAMEKDMDDRNKLRRERVAKAKALKEKGNGMVKLNKYEEALQLYTDAMAEDKSQKALYTNRALCYLKLDRPNDCIADCSRVLDICEFLDRNKGPGVREARIKALMRRAVANRVVGNLSDAVADVALARTLDKSSAELIQLEQELQEDKHRADMAAAVTKAVKEDPTQDTETPPSATTPKVEPTVATPQQEPTTTTADTPAPAPAPASAPAPVPATSTTATIEELPEDAEIPDLTSSQENAAPAVDESCAVVVDAVALKALNTDISKLIRQQEQLSALCSGRKPEQCTADRKIGKSASTVQQLLRTLAVALQSEETRVLFREQGGVDVCARLLHLHEFVPPCAMTAAAALAVACDNKHNAQAFLEYDQGASFSHVLVMATQCGSTPQEQMTAAAAAELIENLSAHALVRKALATSATMGSLLTSIDTQGGGAQAAFGLGRVESLLTACANVVFEDAGKALLQTSLQGQPAGERGYSLFLPFLRAPIMGLRERASKAVMNLVTDAKLRSSMLQFSPGAILDLMYCLQRCLDPKEWDAKKQDCLESTLGALMNLSLDEQSVKLLAAPECELATTLCSVLDPTTGASAEAVTRASGVIARCCGKNVVITEALVSTGLVPFLCQQLATVRGLDATSSATQWAKADQCVRALGTCLTKGGDNVAKIVVDNKSSGVFAALVKLLSGTSDQTIGNASLCLLEIAKIDDSKSTLGALNAVPALLNVARNQRGVVQRNAAISLAKLATHPPCLEQLRSLHGLEILSAFLGK